MDDRMTKGRELSLDERPLMHADSAEMYRPDTSIADRMAGHEVHGTMRRLTVRDGLNISCFDVSSSFAFDGTAISEPSLAVALMLDCSGGSRAVSEISSEPLDIRYTPGTLLFCFTRAVATGTYDVPPSSRFRGVEVRLSHARLARLQALDLFARATAEHPFHMASNAGMWIGAIPASNEMRLAGERVLSAALARPSDDLAVESNGLAVLNLALAAMRSAHAVDAREAGQSCSKLEAARDLMLGNLSHTWSIREIAARVGLSEKRLKTGFRAMFGSPVYAFLQNARLAKARQLLEDGHYSVTEVSLAVGYANPSHFAFLFRRAFAEPPSALGTKPPAGTSVGGSACALLRRSTRNV
jgi:AraC-like DNA-binding protein